jgi:hypothetical protein
MCVGVPYPIPSSTGWVRDGPDAFALHCLHLVGDGLMAPNKRAALQTLISYWTHYLLELFVDRKMSPPKSLVNLHHHKADKIGRPGKPNGSTALRPPWFTGLHLRTLLFRAFEGRWYGSEPRGYEKSLTRRRAGSFR